MNLDYDYEYERQVELAKSRSLQNQLAVIQEIQFYEGDSSRSRQEIHVEGLPDPVEGDVELVELSKSRKKSEGRKSEASKREKPLMPPLSPELDSFDLDDTMPMGDKDGPGPPRSNGP